MVGNNKQTKHKFSVSLKHQMCRVITMITTIMVRVTSFSCSQIVPKKLFLIPNCLHSSSTFYYVLVHAKYEYMYMGKNMMMIIITMLVYGKRKQISCEQYAIFTQAV